MPYMLIRHKVKDYTKWKSVFDAHKDMRKSGGEKTYQIFHTANNPKNLVLLFEWDNLENGRQFVKSKELRQAMREAGVSDKPEFYFLEKGEQGSV
jgi:heme-degrading monooxygenase HmoA